MVSAGFSLRDGEERCGYSHVPVKCPQQSEPSEGQSGIETLPLAVIRPRNTYYDFYEKIWVGLNVVHAAFPKGWKSNPGMHAKRLLKYADWVFIYGLYLVKYRLLKKKF